VLGDFAIKEVKMSVVFSLEEPDYFLDVGYALTPAHTGKQGNEMGWFFRLGMENLFVGYDHLLFLLALIVLAFSSVLVLLPKGKHAGAGRTSTSVFTLLCGAGWLIDRVFALGWIPF